MNYITVDIDQFGIRNLNITTNIGVSKGLYTEYVSLTMIMNKIYVPTSIKRHHILHKLYIPKEVYNITKLNRLNIFDINLSKISNRIINLNKIYMFLFEKCNYIYKVNLKGDAIQYDPYCRCNYSDFLFTHKTLFL